MSYYVVHCVTSQLFSNTVVLITYFMCMVLYMLMLCNHKLSLGSEHIGQVRAPLIIASWPLG